MAELALLWHMHQPDYRDPASGDFTRPWVLLHALKDYAEMAQHLERHPGVRCSVNFVPVLLEQIEDYGDQFAREAWRDPLLRALALDKPDALPEADRSWLLEVALDCHAPTMIEPFAGFRKLRDLLSVARTGSGNGLPYLSGRYFSDLATWCVLAWCGESLRREGGVVTTLMAKGSQFELADRRALLVEIARVLHELLPRWRALAERGQVELCCSPSHHPIAPLLLDFSSAREAHPDCALPAEPCYHGGRTRLDAQLAEARASHERRFGRPPLGLWPAEGALSQACLAQIAAAGFRWAASGQGVLAHSAGPEASTDRPWQAGAGPGSELTLFFRDDRLSDLIGFEYSKWHGRDAARHFMAELQARQRAEPQALVTVFLDGENAWAHYPYNGWYFIDDLYQALEEAREIGTTTLADACATQARRRKRLSELVAGSWVQGTLSTWIGSPAKNRAWELLSELKQSVDRVLASSRLDDAQRGAILHRLAVCEGSDWFWWLGDDNPPTTVAYFDRLFRANLEQLYRLLELPVPASLAHPVGRRGGGPDSGGPMRRAN